MTDTPIPEGTSPLDPWTLESLLAEGGELGAPEIIGAPGTSALAMLIAAARGPAVEAELLGEDQILAAFRDPRRVGIAIRALRRSRRSAMFSALLGSKIALASAVGVVAVGGASAAAYMNALPQPAQDFAHHAIGAPAPKAANAVGPDVSGAAAFGLCTAFAADKAGGTVTDAVAFQNLATAAGGAANIDAFCAKVSAEATEHAKDPSGEATKAGDEATEHAKDPSGEATKAGDEATEHANDPSGHGTGRTFGSQRDESGNGGSGFRSSGQSGNGGSGGFGSGSRH